MTLRLWLLRLGLAVLAVALIGPGVQGMLLAEGASPGLRAAGADAHSHLRALNGMMAAIGLAAGWALLRLTRARRLVRMLGGLMLVLVTARLISLWLDGVPGLATLTYLGVEAALAILFLGWPPPPSHE